MDYISSTVLMLLTIIVLGALLITILTRLSEINKTLTKQGHLYLCVFH